MRRRRDAGHVNGGGALLILNSFNYLQVNFGLHFSCQFIMSPVRRIAQIVHLKPSAVAAYKECHANVWPEVLQQIKDCNIVDCEFRLIAVRSISKANGSTLISRLDLLRQ